MRSTVKLANARLCRSRWNWVAATLLGPICFLFGGCATYQAAKSTREPPNVAAIELGVKRELVEQELGKPVLTENNICTYEYYRPRKKLSPAFVPVALVLELYSLGLVYWSYDMDRIDRLNTVQMDIVYGPNDKVIGLSHRAAESAYRDWLDSPGREANLEKLEQSSNQGYAPAQLTQAVRYRFGLWGAPVDPVRAYLWARLAAFGGQPAARETLTAWAETLPPNDLAEAERLFREWPQ